MIKQIQKSKPDEKIEIDYKRLLQSKEIKDFVKRLSDKINRLAKEHKVVTSYCKILTEENKNLKSNVFFSFYIKKYLTLNREQKLKKLFFQF